MDVDMEKKRDPSPEDGSPSPTLGEVITTHGDAPLFTRIIDSFRQNPHARVTTLVVDDDGKPLPDQPPAQPALAMKLKERHLQMIAIGGSIGK
jgi:yeast amino acid transporter